MVYDPTEPELRVIDGVTGDAPEDRVSPADLAWLRSRLDPELSAALAQRGERRARIEDRHGWKEGDVPHAAVGSRVSFADVFPYAWDLVTTYQGRRYALIDRYLLDRRAEQRPCELEVVALATGTSMGVVEATSAQRSKGKARPAPSPAQRIVEQFRELGGWRHLRQRIVAIGRAARRVGTWEADLRDPAAPIAELLRKSGAPPRDLLDRVDALGMHAAPALREALADPGRDRRASCMAAAVLAGLGDPVGITSLVEALRDRERDDAAVGRFLAAMRRLEGCAIDPVLAALEDERDPEVCALLLEGLVATGVEDDRIARLVLDGVRREVFEPELLVSYRYAGVAVVDGLSALLAEHLRVLEAGERGGDERGTAYGEAMRLADVLEDLDALDRELDERLEAVASKRETPRAPMVDETPYGLDDPQLDDPMDVDIDDLPVAMPVRVAPRPGRNEPCWCGSGKKYKKCHWAADEAAPLGARHPLG